MLLIGAGVVGRAIAEAHLSRGLAFCLADRDPQAIASVSEWLIGQGADVAHCESPIKDLSMVVVAGDRSPESGLLVIESILEDVGAKRGLFGELQRSVGPGTVLCTNTSTLLISDIASDDLVSPEQVVGLHFFMPVAQRSAVEVVAGDRSSSVAVARATEHAKRLGKRAVHCKDGPGFIVNRILSPYLNQALVLLCRGATAAQIERVARAYGMPLSPLELIDWIGIPTMYHAGKAYWLAFPKRIAPSPLVPALLKRKRLGRASGEGLYDYSGNLRSDELSPLVRELIETYRVDGREFSDGDVLKLLSIPMWIEANKLIQEGVADSMETVDLAVVGGLGFSSSQLWSEFFSELGESQIRNAIHDWKDEFCSMAEG